MGKNLLMVAFEFPPSNGASIQRTYNFYRHLKNLGWNIKVLTASPAAYPSIDEQSISLDNPADIVRAPALDAQRHLSIKGKHFSWSLTPDRWGITWIPSAIYKGRALCHSFKPDVIWSTSPIPSTHYIAHHLAQKFDLPWIADYRDPFRYMHGFNNSVLDRVQRHIDLKTLTRAQHIIFATDASCTLYQQNYGNLIKDKCSIINNGYDEDNFEKVKQITDYVSPFDDTKYSIYYGGVLYPDGRDPVPIFSAIAKLISEKKISKDKIEIIFQGAGDGSEFRAQLMELELSNIVNFESGVPFLHAIKNMMMADALLIIQDRKFNAQIPGKIYEYLYTQKPILIKGDKSGETVKLGQQFENVFCGESVDELEDAIIQLLNASNQANRITDSHSRKGQAIQLDKLLQEVI